MNTPPHETPLRDGLRALAEGRPAEAASSFHDALRIARRAGSCELKMRSLSYLGLSLALARGPTPETIRACEMAARRHFLDAALLLNLGRVYLLAGEVPRAIAAFEKGLRLAPRHRDIRLWLARAERRAPPPIRALRRGHPLNVILGRLRHRLRRTARAKRRAALTGRAAFH
jgi:tetratricopeptide (TPR) repeat protein